MTNHPRGGNVFSNSHFRVAVPAGAFTLAALIGAIVCTVTHHDEQASLLYGVALGGVGAGAATTSASAVQATNVARNGNGNGTEHK